MTTAQWVLGAVAAGLWLGTAHAAPVPVTKAPVADMTRIEAVQFYYDPPPRRYYGPPRYRSYESPRYGYYASPPRYAYGPPRYRYYEGPRRYYEPRPSYGYRNPGWGQRRLYTKDDVRAWNRMHGF